MTTRSFPTAARNAKHLVQTFGVRLAITHCQVKQAEARRKENNDRCAYWLAVEGEISYQYSKPQ